MKSTLSSRQQATILVISLLFHITLLTIIFMREFDHSSTSEVNPTPEMMVIVDNEIIPEQESNTSFNDWVAIAANPSLHSSPVQDPDLPQQSTPQYSSYTPDTHAATASTAAIDQAIDFAKHILHDSDHTSAIEQPSEEPTVFQSDSHTIVSEPVIPSQSTSSAPSKSQKFTFTQLAQGFADHLQQAGMAVKSDRTGTASIDQLKHLHFCQKIISCIVTSYKIHHHSISLPRTINRTLIKLALNENGSIHTLDIMQSSGNRAVDQFLLRIFKDASSSFPPLPQSFKDRPYQLPLFNIDHLEALQTANGWYINNIKS